MDLTDSVVREPGPAPQIGASWSFVTRFRTLNPAIQGLIALAIYVGVFILAFAQALITRMNIPAVNQNGTDPNIFMWAWEWWPYALSHGLNPLFSAQIGAPAGFNLSWATTMPSVTVPVAPITVLFGPDFSFNLVLLLAPPASAWATFVVTRRLTGRFWPALLAGSIYGFNIYEVSHEAAGQPDLTVTLLIPLIVWLVLLWWDGMLGPTGFAIWMTLALALEFYTLVETFAEMTMVLAAALVIGFVVAGQALRPTALRLATLMGIAYAGAIVLASPYLVYMLKHNPGADLFRQSPNYSLDMVGLIMPRGNRMYFGLSWMKSFLTGNHSTEAYVGIPLLVLFIVMVVTTWSSKITRLLAVTFLVVIALAAGPNLIIDGQKVISLPWGSIWSLPLLKSAETYRFIVYVYLLMAIAFALWLAKPVTSKWLLAARWGLGLLALVAIFANLYTFSGVVVPETVGYRVPIAGLHPVDELPAFITDGLYKKYLHAGETVVVLSHRGNAGMIFQADAHFYFRIAGGYINDTPVDALPAPVAALAVPNAQHKAEFQAYVKAAKVGAVIVEQAWSQSWMYSPGSVGMKSMTVGGVTIFYTGY